MPLEQTDMNVGFNSGADKVTFRRYHQGSSDNNLSLPGPPDRRLRFADSENLKDVLVIPGNSLDCLSRN